MQVKFIRQEGIRSDGTRQLRQVRSIVVDGVIVGYIGPDKGAAVCIIRRDLVDEKTKEQIVREAQRLDGVKDRQVAVAPALTSTRKDDLSGYE